MNGLDFNFSDVDWTSSDHSGRALTWTEFCDEFFLQVVNSEATRKDQLLDLVLTNNESTIVINEVLENVTFSDHAMIVTKALHQKMV